LNKECVTPSSFFAVSCLRSWQLMGIETSAEHGGAETSFTSAIITIEELAKVDPSVSVLCDVHNTLVNTVIRKYGTPEQQERWLPQLAESKARQPFECGHRPVP
jgi:alkylation response protein AidB-like acyl-CoA dehydrogenase